MPVYLGGAKRGRSVHAAPRRRYVKRASSKLTTRSRSFVPRGVGLKQVGSWTRSNTGGDIYHLPYRKEFITDIVGATNFTPLYYQGVQTPVSGQGIINPANAILFPWLSTIALRFTSFRFRSLKFCYKATSGTAVAGSNPALGYIILAINYDVAAPAFSTKQQMEDYKGAQRTVTYQDNCLTADLKRTHGGAPVTQWYVGTAPPGSDVHLYSPGNFTIAAGGQQIANQIIGELWVEYAVDLIFPTFVGVAQQGGSQYYQNVDNTMTDGNGLAGAWPSTTLTGSAPPQPTNPPTTSIGMVRPFDATQIPGKGGDTRANKMRRLEGQESATGNYIAPHQHNSQGESDGITFAAPGQYRITYDNSVTAPSSGGSPLTWAAAVPNTIVGLGDTFDESSPFSALTGYFSNTGGEGTNGIEGIITGVVDVVTAGASLFLGQSNSFGGKGFFDMVVELIGDAIPIAALLANGTTFTDLYAFNPSNPAYVGPQAQIMLQPQDFCEIFASPALTATAALPLNGAPTLTTMLASRGSASNAALNAPPVLVSYPPQVSPGDVADCQNDGGSKFVTVTAAGLITFLTAGQFHIDISWDGSTITSIPSLTGSFLSLVPTAHSAMISSTTGAHVATLVNINASQLAHGATIQIGGLATMTAAKWEIRVFRIPNAIDDTYNWAPSV